MNTGDYDGADYLRFADYIHQQGPLRRADSVTVEEDWINLVARGTAPGRMCLSSCYLRDYWDVIEDRAQSKTGHFVEGRLGIEPYQILLAAAADFDQVIRELAIGPPAAMSIFTSVQLHRHLEGFAGDHLVHTVKDDEAVERAVYWTLRTAAGTPLGYLYSSQRPTRRASRKLLMLGRQAMTQ